MHSCLKEPTRLGTSAPRQTETRFERNKNLLLEDDGVLPCKSFLAVSAATALIAGSSAALMQSLSGVSALDCRPHNFFVFFILVLNGFLILQRKLLWVPTLWMDCSLTPAPPSSRQGQPEGTQRPCIGLTTCMSGAGFSEHEKGFEDVTSCHLHPFMAILAFKALKASLQIQECTPQKLKASSYQKALWSTAVMASTLWLLVPSRLYCH